MASFAVAGPARPLVQAERSISLNALLEQLRHQPLPDLAAAVRARSEEITSEWIGAVRELIPRLDQRTGKELEDNNPAILDAIATALASEDADALGPLIRNAPVQGLSRFQQDYTLTEIMQEDRVLRGIIIIQVEEQLGRQMRMVEAAALHATIDVMLQQAAVTLVEQQQAKLRAAAEKELKYLSFLSHDLSNNLGSVKLLLELVEADLIVARTGRDDILQSVAAAHKGIDDTVNGMRRLLQHEALRKGNSTLRAVGVNLRERARTIAERSANEAQKKGLGLHVEVSADAFIRSDPELIGIVLQNLVGNAIKYSSRGTVRITAEPSRDDRGGWILAVSDEGPGIAEKHQAALFEAFNRGEIHGQQGVGLGLAIASQAARLLEGKLTMASELGRGATFFLLLPDFPDRSDSDMLPSRNPNVPITHGRENGARSGENALERRSRTT